MATFYVGILCFLFLLAAFDLLVGVSNDAVNFLNSSIGSKAAPFKVILLIAAIGVFVGATTSNGMMDIARHGIMQPDLFSFHEVICIFLAVMVTDVVLLDVFNTLGIPTSTTVSMVFELLGGTFAIAMLKIAGDATHTLEFADLINTDKALSVILGIFLSVIVAFVIGTIVQFVVRMVFTFDYKPKMKYLAGLFGGIAVTTIIHFLLINGLKSATFMTPEHLEWIHTHTLSIIFICFVVSGALMQVLYWMKIDILRIIVLLGTFSLATAFAGNDLVNFIGVPLAGYSSFCDFSANGANNPDQFLMGSLNSSAHTPIIFLIAAGCIMVFALITSKKAHNVVKTELGLSKQNEGDEMFGSSAVARSIVRNCTAFGKFLHRVLPAGLFTWLDGRFNTDKMEMENGAVYDKMRATVNLVISSLLIAFGTSMKLPLSTTYVTFIVAMGSSLSDRAWGRDSAVFRITGTLSVIGGWFITAGVAFCICAVVSLAMFWGGQVIMVAFVIVAIGLLVRSHLKYSQKEKEQHDQGDNVFEQIIHSADKAKTLELLKEHTRETNSYILQFVADTFRSLTDAFVKEDLKTLRKNIKDIDNAKEMEKKIRRRELIGLRKIEENTAIVKSTWFHLDRNCNMQLIYCLKRLCEPCKEHVDNNFTPISAENVKEFMPLREAVTQYMEQTREAIINNDYSKSDSLALTGDEIKEQLSDLRHKHEKAMQHDPNMRSSLIYLSLLQETQELTDTTRHQLRASHRFQE